MRIVIDTKVSMDAARREWERLDVSSDLILSKVMQGPGLCQEMLQRVLPDLDIYRIGYVGPQKSMDLDADAKGLRTDVYVRGDDGAAYAVDDQRAADLHLSFCARDGCRGTAALFSNLQIAGTGQKDLKIFEYAFVTDRDQQRSGSGK